MYIRSIYDRRVNDDEFERLLKAYLDPPGDPNPEMLGVKIVWIRDNADFGSMHISEKHGVSEQEVEEVLLQVPPSVEAKRLKGDRSRTAFWGATRTDRWLVVICEEWKDKTTRYLKPISAFEPDDGDAYWRRL